MPVVEPESGGGTGLRGGWRAHGAPWLAPRCANPACRTGWIHLWRNARAPRLWGGWACSPGCMQAMVAAAVRRERGAGAPAPAAYPHRVPIGLMLVEQGEITEESLQGALAECRQQEQETGEAVRLGAWLVESGLLTEAALTRGLSAQWGCPAFSLANFRPEETAAVMPRLLAEAYGGIPVRAGGGLCLVFAGGVDRSLSYAVARMTGLRVTAGVAGDREWKRALAEYRATRAPRSGFLEAADADSLVRAIAGRVERAKAADARLVRVHGVWWLRLWRRAGAETGLAGCGGVEDWVCTLREGAAGY